MATKFEIMNQYLVITLPKELDHHSAEGIKDEADRIFARENVQSIIFDFKNTVFMDSSGIGVIMGRYKNAKFVGGTVGAVNVNERIKKIFLISGLHKIVQIHDELPRGVN